MALTIDTARAIATPSDLVLVTGANGFIGQAVVQVLLAAGFGRLRCLVRSDRNLAGLRARLDPAGGSAEIVQGNLLSPADCANVAHDASIVIHLAAGTGKSFAGCVLDSAVATRNLLDATRATGALKRFLSLSSLAVHSGFDVRRGALLDEDSPIEREPMKRHDAYAYGKAKQDEIVEAYGREHGVPFTILRPGPVYGPGKAALTGRAGTDSFGLFLALGGNNPLPLVYIDNCADAIVLAALSKDAEGKVLICVDDELPGSARFLRMYKRGTGWFPSVRLPYSVFYALNAAWEAYAGWSHGQLPPVFNRRQCAAYYKPRRYSNARLKALTGWQPRVPFSEAARRYFDYIRASKAAG